MTYTEPPMKFNIGLEKFEPDLPKIPNKKPEQASDKKIGIFVLIVLVIIITLIVIFWKLSSPS